MFAFEIKERTKGHLEFSKRTERDKKGISEKAANGQSINDKRTKRLL